MANLPSGLKPQMALAASSGVSRDHGWSWRHTLDYCKRAGLARCQIYAGNDLLESSQERRDCAAAFAGAGISLTCHSPGLLRREWVNGTYFDAFHEILAHESVKKVIVHHDGKLALAEQLRLIGDFNAQGLVPCIENYYQDYTPLGLLEAMSSWTAVLQTAMTRGLRVVAVLDLPRLYIKAFQDAWPGRQAGAQLLASLLPQEIPLILHCIDSRDTSQSRASWCELGQGMVPHEASFGLFVDRGLKLDHLVLEYEDEELLLGSLDTALGYLANFHVQNYT